MEGDTARGSRKKKSPIVINGSRSIELFDGEAVPRLPIERIIIGPHKDQQQRYNEIGKKLKNRPDIKIDCSKTPYIGR